jgi:putative peptide zinc metalloprotease protein
MSDLSPPPRLRPEIRITPFSSSAREETYLLTCPDGRSLEISRKLRELLSFLDGKTSCEEIAGHLSRAWQTPVREGDIRAWVDQHLLPRDLLMQGTNPSDRAPGSGGNGKALKGVKLIPARALMPLSDRLRFLVRPPLSVPLLWASALCHFLFYEGLFSRTGPSSLFPLSPEICMTGYIVLFLSVLFHELGHLSACRYFRCTHGEVRFGLYLIFPVLYANVTAAWRLPRKARVVVDLGGIYFQLLLTLPLFLLHRFQPDPLWIFLFLELDGMILFALNPFLRFDGYWVCSDLLGVPNLRSRSRRLIRTLVLKMTGRHTSSGHPFLEVRRPEFIGLLLYALGSHVFFIGMFIVLFRFLPHRLSALPEQLGRLGTALTRNGIQDAPTEIMGTLLHLLLPMLLLFAAARMSYSFITGVLRLLKRVLRRLRRNGFTAG